MRRLSKKNFIIIVSLLVLSRIYEFFRYVVGSGFNIDRVVLFTITSVAFAIMTVALWKITIDDDENVNGETDDGAVDEVPDENKEG